MVLEHGGASVLVQERQGAEEIQSFNTSSQPNGLQIPSAFVPQA